jgi:hypothetical protein
MSNPELVKVLDFILNRCDESSIEVVAAAVVRRRRDLSAFGSMKIPDAKQFAQTISSQINIGASIEGMQQTVRDMAIRIIRQEAPELTDEQINHLASSWIPSASKEKKSSLPPELLMNMIDQFVAYSDGSMSDAEEKSLRSQMGDWPERYWKAFPNVICLIIREYLNGEISETEYKGKISTAVAMEA